MKCQSCGIEIPSSTWKVECYSCYKKNNKRVSKKKKYNPCENCAGEDCACCSYGNGY